MILTVILGFVANVFDGFRLVFLNFSSVNPNILGAISYIVGAINGFSYLLPAGAIILCLSIVVAFEFGLWTFKGLVWIYRHIPFIGH